MPLYLLICKATKRLQFLKKLWKMREKIEILNLSQQKKKKKLFSIRIKLSYCKVFHRKFISNRN